MTDHMKALARKGEVTIVEHAGKKTTVALRTHAGGVVTLQGWTTANQLIMELSQMCEDYPDTK